MQVYRFFGRNAKIYKPFRKLFRDKTPFAAPRHPSLRGFDYGKRPPLPLRGNSTGESRITGLDPLCRFAASPPEGENNLIHLLNLSLLLVGVAEGREGLSQSDQTLLKFLFRVPELLFEIDNRIIFNYNALILQKLCHGG